MAEYRKMVITNEGYNLITNILLGDDDIIFTRIATSSQKRTDTEIKNLTASSASYIEQSTSVSKITNKTDENGWNYVEVEGAVNNEGLSTAYYAETILLYAKNKSGQEILYAGCGAVVPAYMPIKANTVTGINFKLITAISDTYECTVVIDPEAVATVGMLETLENEIADLKGFIGYTDSDIYGVEVDLVNNTVTRLAGAVGKSGGADFDNVPMYKRRKCIVSDYDSIYFPEDNIETGLNLYPEDECGYSDTMGQAVNMMVRQPKFYYKVVPLEWDGYGLKKVRYYICDSFRKGFKVHPAFVGSDGTINDYIYLAAYEGCLRKTSDGSYITDNSQGGFSMGTYLLASRAGAKPTTGYAHASMISCAATYETAGFTMASIQSISATQMLYLIEYATFNAQNTFSGGFGGAGATNLNESSITGITKSLGNGTGGVYSKNGSGELVSAGITYRGEENIFGNVWTFLDNITLSRTNGIKINGKWTNLPIPQVGKGYISRFAYEEEYDWIFLPMKTSGNSSVPVGDMFYAQNSSTSKTFIPLFGGCWYDGTSAGMFCLNLQETDTTTANNFGSRIIYIPSNV